MAQRKRRVLPRRRRPSAVGHRRGRLVLAGSGIKAIAQLTVETIAHIRRADIVLYHVPDGIMAAEIQRLNPNVHDLYRYYDDDKRRILTYIQMAERILQQVRLGKYVVALFYGHPSYLVSPGRRAVEVAAAEGYDTQVLPGISSTDNLYADLHLDPGLDGIQIHEATDLLLRDRKLVTDGHVLLLQVGAVGDIGFSFRGYKNAKRHILIERLIEIYGPHHPATAYTASFYPGIRPRIVRQTLEAFQTKTGLDSLAGATTLHLGPKSKPKYDLEMAVRLGIDLRPNINGSNQPPALTYGYLARKALEALAGHETPERFRLKQASKPMHTLFSQIATDPEAARLFQRDPKAMLALHPDLSPRERRAVLRGTSAAISTVTTHDFGANVGADAGPTPGQIQGARNFLNAALQNPGLLSQLIDQVQANVGVANGEANVNNWLLNTAGYNTTLQALVLVQASFQTSLAFYIGVYQTWAGAAAGPVIQISMPNGVLGVSVLSAGMQAPAAVANYSFTPPNPSAGVSAILSWNNDPASNTGAYLFLNTVMSDPPGGLLPNQYVGNYLQGAVWSGDTPPPTNKFLGKINVFSPQGLASVPALDAPSFWANTYHIFSFASDPSKPPKPAPTDTKETLIIAGTSDQVSVTYAGTPIKKPVFKFNRITWVAADDNTSSGSIILISNTYKTTAAPIAGPQFFGRIWPAGTSQPGFVNVVGSPSAASVASTSDWLVTLVEYLSLAGASMAAAMVSKFLMRVVGNCFGGGSARIEAAGPVCDACQDDLDEAQDGLDFADDIIEGDEFDPLMPVEEPYTPANTPVDDESGDDQSGEDQSSDDVGDENVAEDGADDTAEVDTIDDTGLELDIGDLFDLAAAADAGPDEEDDGGKKQGS